MVVGFKRYTLSRMERKKIGKNYNFERSKNGKDIFFVANEDEAIKILNK